MPSSTVRGWLRRIAMVAEQVDDPSLGGGPLLFGVDDATLAPVVFHGSGLCMRSYAAAITKRPVAEVSPNDLPTEWLGNVKHTHRAIDDALGYANLLGELFRQTRSWDGRARSDRLPQLSSA